MTNYRALCAELLVALKSWSPHGGGPLECWEDREEEAALIARAEAALAQPEPAPKHVVDYSRVPEIATEAQIRAAAQYLVKKRHCDGDLIPAIEYAIARWGCPVIKPTPTDEKLLQLAREWNSGHESIEFEFIDDYARAVLARWGNA